MLLVLGAVQPQQKQRAPLAPQMACELLLVVVVQQLALSLQQQQVPPTPLMACAQGVPPPAACRCHCWQQAGPVAGVH